MKARTFLYLLLLALIGKYGIAQEKQEKTTSDDKGRVDSCCVSAKELLLLLIGLAMLYPILTCLLLLLFLQFR